MTDEPSNLPCKHEARGNSQLSKAWLRVTEIIRVVAESTDRQLAAKIAAIGVAFADVIAIIVASGELTSAIGGCVSLSIPLCLIWYPEEIGGFTGYVSRGGNIDTETPPALVSFIGWVILFTVLVMAILAAFESP